MRCDFCKDIFDTAFDGDLNRINVNGYNKKLCNECYSDYTKREEKKVDEIFKKVIGEKNEKL